MFNPRLKRKLGQYIQERAIIVADYEMFTLASGKKTDTYVDMRKVTMQPDSLMLMGRLIYDTVKHTQTSAIGGPATGAIPIVTAALIEATLKHDTMHGFWVNKKRKDHGRQNIIEGSLPDDADIWLVDDVATTGESIARCIRILEAMDHFVRGVTIFVTRDKQVNRLLEELEKIHIHVFYLEGSTII